MRPNPRGRLVSVCLGGGNNLHQSRLGCALLLCDAHRQAEGNMIPRHPKAPPKSSSVPI